MRQRIAFGTILDEATRSVVLAERGLAWVDAYDEVAVSGGFAVDHLHFAWRAEAGFRADLGAAVEAIGVSGL